jgi:hypothetical protein
MLSVSRSQVGHELTCSRVHANCLEGSGGLAGLVSFAPDLLHEAWPASGEAPLVPQATGPTAVMLLTIQPLLVCWTS